MGGYVVARTIGPPWGRTCTCTVCYVTVSLHIEAFLNRGHVDVDGFLEQQFTAGVPGPEPLWSFRSHLMACWPLVAC